MRKVQYKVLTLLVISILSGCEKSIEEQITEHIELGSKYLSEENYKEAIIAFNEVIKLEPRKLPAYTGVILAYDGLNDSVQTEQLISEGFLALSHAEFANDKEEFIKTSIDVLLDEGNNPKMLAF